MAEDLDKILADLRQKNTSKIREKYMTQQIKNPTNPMKPVEEDITKKIKTDEKTKKHIKDLEEVARRIGENI